MQCTHYSRPQQSDVPVVLLQYCQRCQSKPLTWVYCDICWFCNARTHVHTHSHLFQIPYQQKTSVSSLHLCVALCKINVEVTPKGPKLKPGCYTQSLRHHRSSTEIHLDHVTVVLVAVVFFFFHQHTSANNKIDFPVEAIVDEVYCFMRSLFLVAFLKIGENILLKNNSMKYLGFFFSRACLQFWVGLRRIYFFCRSSQTDCKTISLVLYAFLKMHLS